MRLRIRQGIGISVTEPRTESPRSLSHRGVLDHALAVRGSVRLTALILVALIAPVLAANESMTPAGQLPRELEGIAFDQRLAEALPLDALFVNEAGSSIRLGELFAERPVILAPVYYECPMLCSLEMNGLLKALRAMKLTAGEDFDVVTFSIDPGETPSMAAEKKAHYLGLYGRDAAADGWSFLSGDLAAIESLTEAIGYSYRYDPETDLYRHAAGIVVATPSGITSQYFYGVEYSARDLQFALIEAADGRIGGLVDAILLYCFHYDPVTGKYGLVIMNVLRLAGVVTVFLLGGFMGLSVWLERRNRFVSVEG